MADERYVVDIILNARDQMAGALASGLAKLEGFERAAERSRKKVGELDDTVHRASNSIRDRLGTSIDKYAVAVDKADKSTDGLNNRVNRLTNDFDKAESQVKSNNEEMDRWRQSLQSAETRAAKTGDEVDRLARRVSKLSEERSKEDATLQRNIARLGEAEAAHKKNTDAIDRWSSKISQAVRDQDKLTRATVNLNRATQDHDKTMGRALDNYRRTTAEIAKMEARLESMKRQRVGKDLADDYERHIDRMRQSQRKFLQEAEQLQRGRIKLDVDVTDVEHAAAVMAALKTAAGDDIELNVDVDTARARAQLAAFEASTRRASNATGGLLGQLQRVNQQLAHTRNSVASFDNTMRGLIVFAATALFQPLITSLAALAAQLTSVASSALMAGGAIGAGLTSGAAQAMPAIGLLIGAFVRLASVIEAVQQFDLQRKQASAEAQKGDGDATSSINTLANAHDGLKNAQQGVADAHRNMQEAQENLTQARRDARGELEDLIMAEREAQLAAQGAALSQEEAQRNLQRAVASGDVFGTSEAQLGVREAAAQRQRARVEAQRASQAVSSFRNNGSENVQAAEDQVDDARRGIQDAQQAVEQARRGIDSARVSAKQAESDLTSAGANLNFFLSELSETERELYKSILRIRRTFEANIRPIIDIVTGSFVVAVDRMNQVLKNPQFLTSLRGLAVAVSNQMDRMTKTFTNNRWLTFWNKMMDEAARNVRPLTGNFIQLMEVFRRIGLAGQGIFRTMIRLIGDGIDDFDKFVGRGRQLNKFMEQAEKHMVAWWRLGRAVLNLFAALIGATEQHGLKAVRSMTNSLNEAADWLREHGKEVDRFMRGVGVVMGQIGKVLSALAGEIIKSFSPESVRALSQAIRRILIPAFGDTIRVMGQLAIAIEKLSENKAVAEMAKFAIAFTLVSKVVTTTIGMLGGFVHRLLSVASALGTVGKFVGNVVKNFRAFVVQEGSVGAVLRTLIPAAVRVGAAFAGIGAVFVWLAAKFGVLDDIWAAVKRAFSGIVKAVKPAIEDIIESVGELIGVFEDAFSGKASGPIGVLGDILRFVFIRVVKGLVIPAIELLGDIIADVFGGIAKIVSGAIGIVADVLTGDFKNVIKRFGTIFDGIKDIFGGIFRIITSPFRLAWEFVKDLWGSGVGDFFAGVVGGIGDALSGVGQFFSDAFSGAVEVVRDIINWMIENVINRIPGVEIDSISGNVGGVEMHNRSGQRSTGRAARYDRRSEPAIRRASGGRVGSHDGAPRFGIGGSVKNALRGVPGLNMLVAGSDLAGPAKELIEKVLNFSMDSLPDWMSGTGTWIKDNVIDLLKSVPKSLWNLAKDSGDQIKNTAVAGASPVGGWTGGGHVEGPGGVDTIPAWLTRDEFVVTPHGEGILEQMTGVPGILNWLAGRQRPAQGFSTGGRVGFAEGGRAAQAPKASSADTPKVGPISGAFDAIVKALGSFGEDATNIWDDTWKQIQKRSSDGRKFIVTQTNQLSKISIQALSKMSDRWGDAFNDIRKVTQSRLRQTVSFVSGSMSNMTNVVYKGADYIADTVQKALTAFGGKEVKLSLSRPSGGSSGDRKAGGGFIGQPGERGKDEINAVLGRGEVVLNGPQQRVVNALMRGQTTLSDVVKRVRGFHAGGMEQPGFSGGYAGAKLPGGESVAIPGFPGEFINSSVLEEALSYIRKFNLFVTDAFATAGHTGAGHLVTGTALDVVPVPGDSWDGVNAAVKAAVDAGLTVLYDGQFGSTPYPDHGEGHHAHIELEDGTGAAGGVGMVSEIKKLVVEGINGPLKDIAQGALDVVKKSAEEFMAKQGAPAPGSHPDYGEGVLSEGEVRKIFLQAFKITGVDPGGGNLEDLMNLAMEESSWDPGAENNTPAGVAAGGPQGILQVVGGTFNAYKMPGYDDPFNPLDNAIASIRYQMAAYGDIQAHAPYAEGGFAGGVHPEDSGEEFDTGGEVGRRSTRGAAVPITAHAGEWVVNSRQQGRLAGAMRTSIEGVKSMLGFSGGPTSFAGGGEVGADDEKKAKDDEKTEDKLIRFLQRFADYFAGSMRRYFGPDPSFRTNRFGGSASVLGSTRLVIEQWMESLTGTNAADSGRGGRRRPTVESSMWPDGRGRRTQLERTVDFALDAFKGLERVVRSGNDTFQASKDNLNDSVCQFFDGLVGDGGVLDRLSEQFDELVTVMETRLSDAIVKTRRNGRRIIGRSAQSEEIMRRELNNLQAQLKLLIGEEGVITRSLHQARRALAIAKRRGDQDAEQTARATIENLNARQREINNDISQMQLAVLEKMEERMQSRADEIARQAERALTGFSRGRRGIRRFGTDLRAQMQEAMGNIGVLPDLTRASRDTLEEERKRIARLARVARRKGNRDLARDLESQLAQLQGQIVDLTAQLISDAQAEIDRQADRQSARVDYINRYADITQGMGATAYAEGIRRTALDRQRGSLTTQLEAQEKLLARAVRQGFGEGVTGPLEDRVNDLRAQLAENGLAIYQNTIAIRQATIDAINNRQGFLGGVTDTMKQIIEGMGGLTGTTNTALMIQVMTQARDQLITTGEKLRNQMDVITADPAVNLGTAAETILNNLEGLHGNDLVQAIQGLDLNGISNLLGGPDSPRAQQFQDLIQAILDNEAAVIANTEELQNAQQQNQIQQFTSTAWQWFRQAIFNGMGGLNPQYGAGTPYYAAASGGEMVDDGPIWAHRGEIVVPPNFSGMLRRMSSAAAYADAHATGMLMGPSSVNFAARQASLTAANGLQANGSTEAYDRLREALLHQQQQINVMVDKDNANDPVYMANRIAFETNIPTS